MRPEIVIRGGTVVDGTGAPPFRADVAISGDVISEITTLDEGGVQQVGRREIDAEGRLVTPGFVDIHTHLDAQIAWDPIGTSSCWHGVTSVVMGNCGVTFAPCKPADRAVLAEMMESVEDIPRDAILDALPWDWETYGEYYESIDRLPKGPNTGGLVGHCALRTYVMGERGLDEAPASGDDVVAMARLVDEAMSAGALGVSTSRTFLHRVPDGRPVPGTHATADELLAFAEVLGRHGAGIFEGAMRLGERDNERFDNSRSEVALMGEISRQSGRPVSFGLTQSDKRPGLSAAVIGFAHEENTAGANLRPQTTARGVGILFGLDTRTPFDKSPSWQQLRAAVNGRKLQMLRDARVPPDAHQRGRRPRRHRSIWSGSTSCRPARMPATTVTRPIRWRRSPWSAASARRPRSSNSRSRPTVSWSPACRSSTRTSPRWRRCSTIRSSPWDSPMPAPT